MLTSPSPLRLRAGGRYGSSGGRIAQEHPQALLQLSRPPDRAARPTGCGRAPPRPAPRRRATAAPHCPARAGRDIAAGPPGTAPPRIGPLGSDRPMMPILLPVLVRRSMRETTVAATRPAVAPALTDARELAPVTAPSCASAAPGVIVERMAGEEKPDRLVFALQPVGRRPRLDSRQPQRFAIGRSAEHFVLPDRDRLMRRAAPPPASMSTAANTRARLGSSSSKAPAAARLSSTRLLTARGLMRLAKSERSRNGLSPRAPRRSTPPPARRRPSAPPAHRRSCCPSTSKSTPERLIDGGSTLMPSRSASARNSASLSVLPMSSVIDAARNSTG